ncbi:hypothetical protein LEP1GSC059_1300 [Leptospira noguchii serovar Panama str. CZ214]|uniref:Uncharacterized protein n=1 Tax=Leptospira noguchii serovar Panama str. CZ214 TaxID=1001595 RepID=T0FSR6_9LEPT|nr:hypothetical protein LEP1GSC059_1300 [Leptospira noguchii serovar Panama str. CZ214]
MEFFNNSFITDRVVPTLQSFIVKYGFVVVPTFSFYRKTKF